jgi:hypothetical protein
MQRLWTRTCFIIVAAASIGLSDAARATSVAISRMGEGIVCNGWAVDADIVATAAHCILRPGHFSVSTGTKEYQALRSWIHPEYSTERFFHVSLGKEELNPDLALLRIIQKDFVAGGEKIDQSNGRKLPQASILYAVRPVVSNRTDSDRRNSRRSSTTTYNTEIMECLSPTRESLIRFVRMIPGPPCMPGLATSVLLLA